MLPNNSSRWAGRRSARRRRRPKWVDVLGHTQHGNLRLFVLLLPWEHLLASASSKTQTAALFACKKSERGGGCGIDGNVAVSAAVTGAAAAATTAMSPHRRRRWPGAAAEEGKIISSTNKTFLRCRGKSFRRGESSSLQNLAQSATYYLAANSLLTQKYTGHGR